METFKENSLEVRLAYTQDGDDDVMIYLCVNGTGSIEKAAEIVRSGIGSDKDMDLLIYMVKKEMGLGDDCKVTRIQVDRTEQVITRYQGAN